MKDEKDILTLIDKEEDLPGEKADDLDLEAEKDLLDEDKLDDDPFNEDGSGTGEEGEGDGWDKEIENLEGKDDLLDDLEK